MPAQLSSLVRSYIPTIWFSVALPRSVNTKVDAAKTVLGLKVEKSKAEGLRKQLSSLHLVDKTHAIVDDTRSVIIPVVGAPPENMVRSYSGELVETSFPDRESRRDPIDDILEKASIPESLKSLLPRKWELFGDVLVFRLDKALDGYEVEIATSYASVLHAKTVLRDVGGIFGEYRKPVLKKITGTDSVTTHVENGIKFRFDVSQIMFSSGNVEERIRMANLRCDGEVVVDMFAGIGYFSLPLAVYQRPKKIISCEINPLAHSYLVENIRLNGANGVIDPFLGDNRDFPRRGFADRIIMGYVKTTHEYLPVALKLLKSEGTIHYHETCPNGLLPERPVDRIRESAGGSRVEVERFKEIKSYAPGISHVVVDARIVRPD